MSDDFRNLEAVIAPLAAPEATTWVPDDASLAERRVQRAKARLTERLAALDHRARTVARQSAWVAGMVLLGLAGTAAAAAMLGGYSRRRRRGYRDEARGPGVGTALMLAALGLISRRLRSWEPRLGRAYER
jgi:hypothetical protein